MTYTIFNGESVVYSSIWKPNLLTYKGMTLVVMDGDSLVSSRLI